MLKCVIIDDEPLAIQLLADYVDKTAGLQSSGTFSNAIDALKHLEQEPPDLLFLDIQMPDITGLQLGKIVQGRIPIIFTTAYDQYALEGYELDVVDYLLKPISFSRFLVGIQKARKRIGDKGPKPLNHRAEKELAKQASYIFVKTNYKMQKVDFEDILYFEGLGDYVKIHTVSGRILTLENMKHFESILPKDQFMRVHKSYLISFERIDFIERNRIVIGKTYIPIGTTYQDAFWCRIGRKK